MTSFARPLTLAAAISAAVVALAPAAQARHHHRHHAHLAKARPLPAHQRPDWVGLAGAPVPGVVDLGLGPVFPVEGWPKTL